MIDLRTPHDRCPHCGSYETHEQPANSDIDRVIASMALAAIIVVRLAGKSHPILAPAMLAGAVMGFACGLRLEPAASKSRTNEKYRCHSCGEAFAW